MQFYSSSNNAINCNTTVVKLSMNYNSDVSITGSELQ
jgi:hypothetical protein